MLKKNTEKVNIFEYLKQGVEEILLEDELKNILEQGKTLCVKAGFDPTAPDIHLGHTILLNKMRQFQDLGHTVSIIIGDFTAMIGDPTGKSKTRPKLSPNDILKNAKTYEQQIFKILDPLKTNLLFNSHWLNKLSSRDFIEIISKFTIARIIERDDFQKRIKSNCAIGMHELLYPILQGYDSVAINADIELGGTDQKFNLLVGRDLQKQSGLKPQIVMTLPLIEGTDGKNKMSKSLNNYIGVSEEPDAIFGKLMSISDELMWKYISLLSFKPKSVLKEWQNVVKDGVNPKEIKIEFAKEIVARFHNGQCADKAACDFEKKFRKKETPDEMITIELSITQNMLLANILKMADLVKSTSEANRLIKQGAIKIEGIKISNTDYLVKFGTSFVLQIGKIRFYKLNIAKNENNRG